MTAEADREILNREYENDFYGRRVPPSQHDPRCEHAKDRANLSIADLFPASCFVVVTCKVCGRAWNEDRKRFEGGVKQQGEAA